MVRSLLLGLTGSRMTPAPVTGPHAKYFRQLSRMSAAFAFVADSVLILLGGKFKFKEKLSGRLADVLIHLYMAQRHAETFREMTDARPRPALAAMGHGGQSVYNSAKPSRCDPEFPCPRLGWLVRLIVFPFGPPYKAPSDKTVKAVAQILLHENESRDRLTDGVFISDRDDATGRVNKAFHLVLEAAGGRTRHQECTKTIREF